MTAVNYMACESDQKLDLTKASNLPYVKRTKGNHNDEDCVSNKKKKSMKTISIKK